MPPVEIHVFQRADGRIPLEDWLNELEPKAHAKCLACIGRLAAAGNQLGRPTAAPLGDGIHELRPTVGRVQYRILYFFHPAGIAILSHGTIKSRRVDQRDIARAKENKRLVEQDHNRYTATWS